MYIFYCVSYQCALLVTTVVTFRTYLHIQDCMNLDVMVCFFTRGSMSLSLSIHCWYGSSRWASLSFVCIIFGFGVKIVWFAFIVQSFLNTEQHGYKEQSEWCQAAMTLRCDKNRIFLTIHPEYIPCIKSLDSLKKWRWFKFLFTCVWDTIEYH